MFTIRNSQFKINVLSLRMTIDVLKDIHFGFLPSLLVGMTFILNFINVLAKIDISFMRLFSTKDEFYALTLSHIYILENILQQFMNNHDFQ